MKETVRIEGMRELEQALAELGNPNQRRAVGRRALRKAAQPIAETARSMAPRRLGHLVGSITVGTRVSGVSAARAAFGQVLQSGGTRSEAVQALRNVQRASSSLVELHVGPGRHPQAITQEFGTYFHPPQPYMRPAWDGKSSTALDLIKTELWTDIQKTAARMARRAARQAAG